MIAKRDKVATYANEKYKIACDIDWAIRTTKNCKTFLDSDMVICKFLDGGVSQSNRLTAIRERFWISVAHYGWMRTLIQQCTIGINYAINIICKNIR